MEEMNKKQHRGHSTIVAQPRQLDNLNQTLPAHFYPGGMNSHNPHALHGTDETMNLGNDALNEISAQKRYKL